MAVGTTTTGALVAPTLHARRTAIADEIERLIAALDEMDGDPDLEDGHDAEADGADTEPALGWTEQEARFARYGVNDPGEAEATWNELHASQSQAADPLARGVGIEDDDEDGADREWSMGWEQLDQGWLRVAQGDREWEITDMPHDWDEREASAVSASD